LLVIRQNYETGERFADLLKWGLIRSSSKDRPEANCRGSAASFFRRAPAPLSVPEGSKPPERSWRGAAVVSSVGKHPRRALKIALWERAAQRQNGHHRPPRRRRGPLYGTSEEPLGGGSGPFDITRQRAFLCGHFCRSRPPFPKNGDSRSPKRLHIWLRQPKVAPFGHGHCSP
jgi:hypothetical protein